MCTKTLLLRAGLAIAVAVSAAAPAAFGQEEKSGLEAMGADPEAGKEAPKEEVKEEVKEESPAAEAAPAPAPVSEGQLIMERARDRMKRAQFVSFDANMYGVGAMAGYTTAASGRVAARKATGTAANPWMFHVTGTIPGKAGGAPINFDMAMLANSREWVNHEERTVHETLKMAAGGKWLTVPNSLIPTEVFDRAPYSRVFRNATFTQEPGQEIGGEECEVVVVESKPARGAGSKGRWYIARSDSFPRRFERLVTFEGTESQIVLEFSNVRVEDSVPPEVTDASMRVAVPEGYAEKREAPKPAPKPPPTPPTPTSVPATNPADTGVEIGGEEPFEGTSAPPAPVEPARPAPPAMAPEFELSKLDGSKVTLASMRGSVVVIDFFGTWSMAAESWHPQLKSVVAPHAEQVRLVPVAVRQREPQLAAELLTRAGISEPVLIGTDALASAYGVQVFPAAAVVAADGRLIDVVQGCGSAASEESLRAAIDRALGTASVPTPPSGEAAASPKTDEGAPVEGEDAKQEPTK